MRFIRPILAFLAAALACAGLGSVVQTQMNLAAVASMGAPVPLAVRAETTALDLLHFAPGYAALVAVAFLIAFSVAGLLRKLTGASGLWLYILAGTAGIVVLLVAMNLALNITPIAAARSSAGIALLAVGGALGGWIFARLKASA